MNLDIPPAPQPTAAPLRPNETTARESLTVLALFLLLLPLLLHPLSPWPNLLVGGRIMILSVNIILFASIGIAVTFRRFRSVRLLDVSLLGLLSVIIVAHFLQNQDPSDARYLSYCLLSFLVFALPPSYRERILAHFAKFLAVCVALGFCILLFKALSLIDSSEWAVPALTYLPPNNPLYLRHAWGDFEYHWLYYFLILAHHDDGVLVNFFAPEPTQLHFLLIPTGIAFISLTTPSKMSKITVSVLFLSAFALTPSALSTLVWFAILCVILLRPLLQRSQLLKYFGVKASLISVGIITSLLITFGEGLFRSLGDAKYSQFQRFLPEILANAEYLSLWGYGFSSEFGMTYGAYEVFVRYGLIGGLVYCLVITCYLVRALPYAIRFPDWSSLAVLALTAFMLKSPWIVHPFYFLVISHFGERTKYLSLRADRTHLHPTSSLIHPKATQRAPLTM